MKTLLQIGGGFVVGAVVTVVALPVWLVLTWGNER
jgi:hypothetical protein